MQFIITLLFVIVTKISSELCNERSSVVLVNQTYNNIKYKEGEYYIDEDGIERGCICLKEICARKCCPFGKAYNETASACVEILDKFDPPVWDGSQVKPGFNITREFHFLHGIRCNKTNNETVLKMSGYAESFHLMTDGRLQFKKNSFTEEDFLGPEKYCLDNFIRDGKMLQESYFCSQLDKEEEKHYAVSASCMYISCFFIILTVGVYVFLPELRNTIHGLVMISFLSSIFIGFLFMATMQMLLLADSIPTLGCVSMSFVIYFSWLAGFFWLNVMCFDIWRKIRSFQPPSRCLTRDDRIKFAKYNAYAFGIPAALTILMAALEFSDLPKEHILLPNLRLHGCFLVGTSKHLYLYTPMAILLVANLVFFTLAAFNLKKANKETQRVRKTEKKEFMMYIKLFIVAGLNWSLEIVSSLFPEINNFWQYTDAYNVLIGVMFFVLYVCKRNVIVALRKRSREVCCPGSKTVKPAPGPIQKTQSESTNSTNISLSSMESQAEAKK